MQGADVWIALPHAEPQPLETSLSLQKAELHMQELLSPLEWLIETEDRASPITESHSVYLESLLCHLMDTYGHTTLCHAGIWLALVS